MKHYSLVLTVIIIAFSGCSNKADLTPWDFIDDNALLVLEKPSGTIDTVLARKDELSIFQVLNSKAKNQLLVFEPISSTEFETLWIANLDQSEFDKLLTEVKMQKVKISERNYSGTIIFETTIKNIPYSFAFRSGIFLYSISPLLVEKAIRNAEKPAEQRAHPKRDLLSGFSMVQDDSGNMYVQNERLIQLVKLPVWAENINHLYQNDVLSLLDLKHSEGSIHLNGFSLGGAESRLRLFQQQQAIPVQITRYVPNYANLFFHFGISDYAKFNEHLIIDSTLSYSALLGNEIVLYNTQKDEAGLIVELADELPQEKLKKAINSNSDFIEQSGDAEIRKFKSTHLFQTLFTQFSLSDTTLYLCVKDDVMLVSNYIDELKTIVDAIDRDNTWSKSLAFQDFFEKGLQESNYSFFMKSVRLESKKSVKLRQILQELSLQNLQWVSMQHSALDNHFYSNVNISISNNRHQPSKSMAYEFDQSIVSFHLSRLEQTVDIIVEDSKNRIHYVDPSKKKSWQFNLSSKIVQSIKPIDYFKNKKTQFQIPTENNLYILDRLGRNVSNYPFELPDKFTFNDVIDYDKSGNYRFLFAKSKEIYLFDKSQKSLAGWNPKRLTNDLLFSPAHYRIGGKDYFLVFLKDGSIFLYNRRGDVIPGYPKVIDTRIRGDYYLQMGSSLQTSYITMVSSEGVIYRVNLGSIKIETLELVRSKNSTFSLLCHQGGQNFSIVRIDPTTVAMFDHNGKLQFEISNPGSSSPQVQVFARMDGSLIYAFFDASQKMTYLFDQSGLLLSPSPMESSLPIQLINESTSDVVYVALDNKLSRILLQ